MSKPLTRFMYAVQRPDGLYYANNNNGRWVEFKYAQLFKTKGTASRAANGNNSCYDRYDQHDFIGTEIITFKLTEVIEK